jgi:hypothetical protein
MLSRLGSNADVATFIVAKLNLHMTNENASRSEFSSERLEVFFDQAALRL